jgi:hypothetical protein
MMQRLLTGVFATLALAVLVTAFAQANQGRWKVDGNGGCYFDASDDGPDQCSAAMGRWKDDGNGGCVFDSGDSGPDQCTPAAAPESEVTAPEDAVGARGEESPGTKQHDQVPAQR